MEEIARSKCNRHTDGSVSTANYDRNGHLISIQHRSPVSGENQVFTEAVQQEVSRQLAAVVEELQRLRLETRGIQAGDVPLLARQVMDALGAVAGAVDDHGGACEPMRGPDPIGEPAPWLAWFPFTVFVPAKGSVTDLFGGPKAEMRCVGCGLNKYVASQQCCASCGWRPEQQNVATQAAACDVCHGTHYDYHTMGPCPACNGSNTEPHNGNPSCSPPASAVPRLSPCCQALTFEADGRRVCEKCRLTRPL